MSGIIAIDAHVLEGKYQGSKTTLYRLLSSIDPETPLQLCLYSHSPRDLARLFPGKPFRFGRIWSRSPLLRLFVEFPLRFWRDRIHLAVFQYILPWATRAVIVVHDILPITHPQYFPRLFRLRTLLFYSWSIRRAEAIIAVSQYTAGALRERFPDQRDRIHVILNGPSFDRAAYFEHDGEPGTSPPGVARRYVLCVGRIEARKKVDLLIEAFLDARLADVDLIIAGAVDLGFRSGLLDSAQIIVRSNLTDGELISLYRGASLFVYPSAAEGFGIPLLDATLFGTPTLASSRTAMPEVGGTLVEYFDPLADDARSILSSRISQHFRERPLARPTRAQRETQFADFSWERAAKSFVDVLVSHGSPGGSPR
jgi:glycosyltransferase involved in cell wall biosynthesis